MANELIVDLSQNEPNALTAIADAERAKLIPKNELLWYKHIKDDIITSKLGINTSCYVNYTLYDNCDAVGETRVKDCGHEGTCYDEDVIPLLSDNLNTTELIDKLDERIKHFDKLKGGHNAVNNLETKINNFVKSHKQNNLKGGYDEYTNIDNKLLEKILHNMNNKTGGDKKHNNNKNCNNKSKS